MFRESRKNLPTGHIQADTLVWLIVWNSQEGINGTSVLSEWQSLHIWMQTSPLQSISLHILSSSLKTAPGFCRTGGRCLQLDAVSSTELHYTAVSCTVLNYTKVNFIGSLYTELHCTVFNCTTLNCTAQYNTALYLTALHNIELHCTTLNCTTLHFPVLHWIALHCTALHRSAPSFTAV